MKDWYLSILLSRHRYCWRLGPFYKHGLFLIKEWKSNYIHYKVWGEITWSFPNFNAATIQVREWITNFIPHIIGHVITYLCWIKLIHVSKRSPRASISFVLTLEIPWHLFRSPRPFWMTSYSPYKYDTESRETWNKMCVVLAHNLVRS